MFPYKVAIFLHLRNSDKVERVKFAKSCKFKMSADSNFVRCTVFSDDCVLHVPEIAKNQNVHTWWIESPRAVQ